MQVAYTILSLDLDVIMKLIADVEKERSLLANVPPNMYESNVCLPELPDYIPPPAHHYNNNNNTGELISEYSLRLCVLFRLLQVFFTISSDGSNQLCA